MPSRRSTERARRALAAQRELLGEAAEEAARPSRTKDEAGLPGDCADAVLRGLDRGIEPVPEALRVAVRHLLDRLARKAPGRSVEVRVPPYAAAQCVPGPRHTRGTPPSVVETDARTWLDLAAGRVSWHDAVAYGRVHASGERSDLTPYLPLAT